MKPSAANARAPLGIFLEPLPQPIDVPEGRAVEHVHLGVGGEEHVEGRTVEAVASVQQGRHAVVAATRSRETGRPPTCAGHALRVAGVDGGHEVLCVGMARGSLRELRPGRRPNARIA